VPWPEHLQTVVIPWTSMKRPSLSLDWLLFDDVTISLLGITTDALTHAESQGWIGGRKHSQLGFGAHALSLCPCLPICVCHNLSLSLSLSHQFSLKFSCMWLDTCLSQVKGDPQSSCPHIFVTKSHGLRIAVEK
jgi:hypothetical protein